ncbi:MAG: hypothetical protein IPI67_37275 [Myxococcales bacterium]|nr:hypothetical protein [Myxococcales bacterium]
MTAAAIRPPYRPCLSVFVVWHPSFSLGQAIAERVYSHLCRDVHAPTSRGIGAPVFFRSAAESEVSSLPMDVPIDAAHHTAVVVLVDDNMINGAGWDGFVDRIWRATEASGGVHRLFPVRLSEHAFNLSKEIQVCNYLRLNAKDDGARSTSCSCGSPTSCADSSSGRSGSPTLAQRTSRKRALSPSRSS